MHHVNVAPEDSGQKQPDRGLPRAGSVSTFSSPSATCFAQLLVSHVGTLAFTRNDLTLFTFHTTTLHRLAYAVAVRFLCCKETSTMRNTNILPVFLTNGFFYSLGGALQCCVHLCTGPYRAGSTRKRKWMAT